MDLLDSGVFTDYIHNIGLSPWFAATDAFSFKNYSFYIQIDFSLYVIRFGAAPGPWSTLVVSWSWFPGSWSWLFPGPWSLALALVVSW